MAEVSCAVFRDSFQSDIAVQGPNPAPATRQSGAAAVFEYAGGREIERVQTPYDLTRTQTWTDWREPDVLQYVETSTTTLLTGLDNSWNDDGYLTVRERMHDCPV